MNSVNKLITHRLIKDGRAEKSVWRLVVVISVISICLVWVSMIFFYVDEYRLHVKQEQDRMFHITQVEAEEVTSIIKGASFFLRFAESWLSFHQDIDPRTDPEFIDIVSKFKEESRFINDIRLVSDQGELFLLSRTLNSPKAFVGDRQYYQVQLDNATKGMYIGKPIISRTDGTLVIPLSYPLSKSHHGIRLILITLNSLKLFTFFQNVLPQPDGWVALTHTDGTILAGTNGKLNMSGLSLVTSDFWKSSIAKQHWGTLTYKPLNQQTANLLTWSYIQNFPLILVVSRGESILIADFWSSHVIQILIFLLLTFLVGFLLHRLFNFLKLIESSRKNLENLVCYDSLTGVLSRRIFLSRAEEEIKRNERYEHPLCLALMDLDHFKQINDTQGHDAGDHILQSFTKAIESNLRDSDFMGRLGGEEFVILLPETSLDSAKVLCNRLCLAVNKIKHQSGILGVSIGVVAHQQDEPLAQLLKRADLAMYQAKKEGRNRVIAS